MDMTGPQNGAGRALMAVALGWIAAAIRQAALAPAAAFSAALALLALLPPLMAFPPAEPVVAGMVYGGSRLIDALPLINLSPYARFDGAGGLSVSVRSGEDDIVGDVIAPLWGYLLLVLTVIDRLRPRHETPPGMRRRMRGPAVFVGAVLGVYLISSLARGEVLAMGWLFAVACLLALAAHALAAFAALATERAEAALQARLTLS